MKYNGRLMRGFALIRSFFSPSQPSFLILYVTNRCNFRCDFCFYHAQIEKGLRPDELTLDEFSKISEKIGPLIQLSITGGEPFMRPDLADITGLFIENTNAAYITIPTNASLSGRIMEYLENVLPKYPQTYFRIVFSIDGIGDEHDLSRSQPGSYKKIQESYAAVNPLRKKYRNLVLDSNSVFTSKSEVTLLNTVKAISREFQFDNISITYARGDVKVPELKDVSAQKYLEVNGYLQNLKRTKEKRLFYPFWRAVRDVSREYLIRGLFKGEFITPCVAGRKLLIIGENGVVRPCEILKQDMGNIRDFNYEIRKLLSWETNQKLLRWIEDSQCKCSFECALAANVLWGKSSLLKLLKASIANAGKS